MVLGAGRGTRLSALGLQVPKILLDVGGEPLLARQLHYLSAQGAELVVVNAHHHAEQVREFAQQHEQPPRLVIVTEPELLGTAGGVRNALPQFGPGPVVVLYGDVLTRTPLAALTAAHQALRPAATLAVYESREIAGKGTVEVEGDRVLGFREKALGALAPDDPPALVNAGIYVVEPSLVFDLVASGDFADFGHDVFPEALGRGRSLAVYRLSEPVLDVGTPEAWRLAQEDPSWTNG
jgi:NDP-sugar pyrophosphorylase family protein